MSYVLTEEGASRSRLLSGAETPGNSYLLLLHLLSLSLSSVSCPLLLILLHHFIFFVVDTSFRNFISHISSTNKTDIHVRSQSQRPRPTIESSSPLSLELLPPNTTLLAILLGQVASKQGHRPPSFHPQSDGSICLAGYPSPSYTLRVPSTPLFPLLSHLQREGI